MGKTASPVVWEKYHRMFAEFSKPGAQKLRTIAIKHGVLNTGSVYAAFQKIRNGTAPYPPPADLRGPVLKPNGKIL